MQCLRCKEAAVNADLDTLDEIKATCELYQNRTCTELPQKDSFKEDIYMKAAQINPEAVKEYNKKKMSGYGSFKIGCIVLVALLGVAALVQAYQPESAPTGVSQMAHSNFFPSEQPLIQTHDTPTIRPSQFQEHRGEVVRLNGFVYYIDHNVFSGTRIVLTDTTDWNQTNLSIELGTIQESGILERDELLLIVRIPLEGNQIREWTQ